MKRRFDSNTDALVKRADINKSALYDLEEWIFEQISLNRKMRVLDLGCGTGKQMFALHKLLSPQSKIIGIDVSPEAVAKVNECAEEERITNIKAKECELDTVISNFEGSLFDLILSAYAIYYSNDMLKLLSSLPILLTENGQVFICGYGKDTNQEIYNIINRLVDRNSLKIDPTDDFISEEEIAEAARHYSSYRTVRLANKVIFYSADAVLGWWTNHNSYVEEVHQEVVLTLEKYFEKNRSFSLSKNVLGVLYES